jgi:hypothetical protein
MAIPNAKDGATGSLLGNAGRFIGEGLGALDQAAEMAAQKKI